MEIPLRGAGVPASIVVFLGCALSLASCGGAVSGTLERGGTGDFKVSAALTPAVAGKIRDLMAFSQAGPAAGPLINGPEIALSMSGAPGVAQVSFRNTGPASLEGPVKISSIRDFLAPSGKAGFISYTENPGGGGRAAVTLNRETAPAALSMISPDLSYYLYFLFAPIVTGEPFGKDEYLAQVGLFHGPAVAEELAQARIQVSVEFPAPLTAVRGGTFSGRKAEFIIPLADLLVLEQPLSYEAVWK
jgi:hypothetical protein